MGYEYRFVSASKPIVEGIQNCITQEDFLRFLNADGYIFLPDVFEEIFDFGKYYENSGEIYKLGKPLFISEELSERYEDYEPIICGKEAFLSAINWQRDKIIGIYKRLLNEDEESHFEDEKAQLKALEHEADDHLWFWQHGGINIDETVEHITESWMYEHTIFELVRLYKTFDWEHNCLIFMGW